MFGSEYGCEILLLIPKETAWSEYKKTKTGTSEELQEDDYDRNVEGWDRIVLKKQGTRS